MDKSSVRPTVTQGRAWKMVCLATLDPCLPAMTGLAEVRNLATLDLCLAVMTGLTEVRNLQSGEFVLA